MSATTRSHMKRPRVADFNEAVDFFAAVYEYYKVAQNFSLRRRCADLGTVSQASVSQLLHRRRGISLKNLAPLSEVFDLREDEQNELAELIRARATNVRSEDQTPLKISAHESQKVAGAKIANHVLSHWTYPFVKDLGNLSGFKADPVQLEKMLAGFINQPQIKKAMAFLLEQGFWRKDAQNKIILNENFIATTKDIPSSNIRKFHKKALGLAAQGISTLPPHERKATTLLMTLDENKMPELRALLDRFENDLAAFMDKNPTGKDRLVQVAMHLTPIGSAHENDM